MGAFVNFIYELIPSAHQSDINVGKKYRYFSWIRVGLLVFVIPKKTWQELAFRSTFLEYLGGCVNSAKPPFPPLLVEFCQVLLLIKNRIFHRGQDVFLVDFFWGVTFC